MRLAVIGTGYVGLSLGACFAEIGHDVVCVDSNATKIRALQKGRVPIYEPGLSDLVKRNVQAQRLRFSTDVGSAIEWALVVMSAVGTPADGNHRADLSQVKEVAEAFGQYCDGYKLFVNKSTVPVGTGALCKQIIDAQRMKRSAVFEYDVVANPEFMREGAAVADCLKPDRIVVGVQSDRACAIMEMLHKPIIEKGSIFFRTTVESAEIIKYASNAMLATKISFMNEIARLCERVGADITAVERGVGLDARIGRRFLHAGIGFGGSCFPKDLSALIAIGKHHGSDLLILQAVRDANEAQKQILVAKLLERLPDLTGRHIAVWGLAFKPKTDDMRESPALTIIDALLEGGAQVTAFDPAAMPNSKKNYLPKIRYAKTALAAVKGADALLLVTDWDEFRSVDFAAIKKLMRGTVVGDGRNIWQPEEVRKHGLTYFSIGRA